jgi:ubiquinone/menaquinone biosynthesis C-methylase UbiE
MTRLPKQWPRWSPAGQRIGTQSAAEESDPRQVVRAHFTAEATYWEDVYQKTGVAALIYQQRRQIALAWADRLALPRGAPVLELGCGAGLTAVAVAERGLCVTAVDATEAMLARTRRRAADAGVRNRLRVQLGDAQALGFADQTFELVIALGLVPWLQGVGQALEEIARVLRPGGYLILTVDNRQRIDYFLDPLHNIPLRSLKYRVKAVLRRLGLWHRPEPFRPNLHTAADAAMLLRAAGLEPLADVPLGFGPFTLFGRSVLPQRIGVYLHRLLQLLAERGALSLRERSGQYVVLARKPVLEPLPARDT